MSSWIDELAALSNPLTHEKPSGPNLEYDQRYGDMERAAQGRKEQEFGDTFIEAEPPDWKSLRSLSLELCHRTHDLRVGVRLAESLVNLEGLQPLPAALGLLANWIENEWDTLHPALDPDDGNDPTIRVNAFADLTNPERMLHAIEEVALVDAPGHRPVCFRELIESGATNDARSTAEINAIFLASDQDKLQSVQTAVRESLLALDRLDHQLAQRLDPVQTPEFGPLRQLLERIETALAEYTQNDNFQSYSDWDSDSDTNNPNPESISPSRELSERIVGKDSANHGTISTRQDVVNTLRRICEYYQRHEPSSPVPLLLQRAERLATMNFFDILQDMASAGLPQAEEVCGPRPKQA